MCARAASCGGAAGAGSACGLGAALRRMTSQCFYAGDCGWISHRLGLHGVVMHSSCMQAVAACMCRPRCAQMPIPKTKIHYLLHSGDMSATEGDVSGLSLYTPATLALVLAGMHGRVDFRIEGATAPAAKAAPASLQDVLEAWPVPAAWQMAWKAACSWLLQALAVTAGGAAGVQPPVVFTGQLMLLPSLVMQTPRLRLLLIPPSAWGWGCVARRLCLLSAHRRMLAQGCERLAPLAGAPPLPVLRSRCCCGSRHPAIAWCKPLTKLLHAACMANPLLRAMQAQ